MGSLLWWLDLVELALGRINRVPISLDPFVERAVVVIGDAVDVVLDGILRIASD